MRRLGWIGLVPMLLVLGIAVVGDDAARTTRLRVTVTGLPAGVKAKVTVVGPEETAYTISGSDHREVPPGPYTISVHGVHSGQVTHYSVADHYQVQVRDGHLTSTTAAYRVAIPDTTKVLRPRTDIVRVRGKRVYLRADSAQARRLIRGHHLIAGEGPGIPHMLVRRVKAITRDGDQIVVDTVPARLDEVLPAGVVQIEKARVHILQPVAHTVGRAGREDPVAQMEFSLNARSRACATDDDERPTSISSKISYQLDDLDLSFDGSDIEWDVWPPWDAWASVTAAATLTVRHSLKADIEAAIKCEVDAERPINLGCASLAGRIARVGPISFRCDFRVVGSASVETSATWHTGDIKARTVAGLEVGFHTDHGFHGDPTLDTDLIGNRPDPPEHKSEFSASLGLHLGLKGEDATGIAELGVGLEISAGPKVTSTVDEFSGEFEIDPKLVVEASLGKGPINVGDDTEFNLPGVSTTLWRHVRPTPLPSSSPTPTSPSPTPPRSTSPGTPSLGPVDRFFVGEWDSGGGNCCRGVIRSNGTGFFYVGAGAGTGREVHVALRPSGDDLRGTVLRSRRGSPPRGSQVLVERTGRYTIDVHVDGEPFAFLCKSDVPSLELCAGN